MASVSNVTPKFNVENAIKNILDYKIGWHQADKTGDNEAKERYANLAKRWYSELENNGYSDVATTLHNTNDVGAQSFYNSYIKNNTVDTTKPTENVDTVKTEMPDQLDTSTADGMIQDTYNVQRSNRGTLLGKYDTLEDYNYNYNPYDSDKGKSIMANYQYQGKVASDNAVASGGASNGGNIDSYASANANRQQIAFTNAGNQAILDDFNARVNNARGILNDMGVNMTESDKSMQTTIGLKQNEEQRQFDNSETSKNNEVARGVETSKVTGYVPESMSYKNNPYFNTDGTLANPEIDYSQIITNAREALKTETDPQRRANLEQTIKDATQARAYKILHVDGYSEWASTMETVAPDRTADYTLADEEIKSTERMNSENNETTRYVTDSNNETNEHISDNNLAGTKYSSDMDYAGTKYSSDMDYAGTKYSADMNYAGNKYSSDMDYASAVYSTDNSGNEGESWDDIMKRYNFSESAKAFLNDFAYQYYVTGSAFENIADVLLANKDTYKLTKLDAQRILNLYKDSSEIGGKPVTEWINSQTWYEEKSDTVPYK